MDLTDRVQIRQRNDWEILAFFNANAVKYSVTGDHLFVIHAREHDLRAGPGDWLSVAHDGEVEVERGDDAVRAQQAIEAAHSARG